MKRNFIVSVAVIFIFCLTSCRGEEYGYEGFTYDSTLDLVKAKYPKGYFHGDSFIVDEETVLKQFCFNKVTNGWDDYCETMAKNKDNPYLEGFEGYNFNDAVKNVMRASIVAKDLIMVIETYATPQIADKAFRKLERRYGKPQSVDDNTVWWTKTGDIFLSSVSFGKNKDNGYLRTIYILNDYQLPTG